MDEKKLAALYLELKTMGANISIPQEDFIVKMKSRPDYVAKVGKVAKSGSIDFDTYITPISANPFDLMREAVSEKPVTEKEVSPVDYYNQAKPQPHAELVDGEPQNVLGLLSPDKKKLPKQVLQEKVIPSAYEQQMTDVRENLTDAPISEIERSIENKRPEFNETDPIQVGMQQREKRAKEVQSLLPTAKQETTLGFKVNPVDLATKIDPNKVTDIGVTALKYAQEKELPNEIRDAVIKGDDRTVSNYLVRNDDNFRLQYADKQDLAQAESSFGKQVSPKERMAFWEGRTNYYSEADKKLYADNAEWLSPYVLLKEGNNQTFDQMLKRIAPNFEKTPETEQQTKAKVDKEIANLGSFKSPEEKLMAYYQILANRQQFLQESMFNNAKSVQPKNIQQNYEENKGNVIADILSYAQISGGLANLATALPFGGGLALSPLVRSQITEDQKEWYENAKKLNAVSKYIKQGGAKQGFDTRNIGTLGTQVWEDLKGRASDIIPAIERNAFGILDIPTTADTRAGTASEQRQIFGQIGATPIAAELKDLKEQQSLAQGVTSTEMWASTAGTQLAIGAMLFGARNAGAGKVAEIAQDFTKVDRYNKLGKALFSNTASSKALNKLYGLTVSAIGTGLEYEAAGVLSGQDEDSEFRKEMGFGSGAAGALGKWFAAPLVNKLSGAKRAIANRLSGAIGEMSEESLQTVYQNWSEYGADGVLKETLRQVVGEEDAPLLDKINNATGFLLSIALMGSLDGDNSEELHNIKAIIPTIEDITGEKVDEKALSEIMNGMSEGVENKPVGVKITDNGVDFKINGKEFSYTEGGGVQSAQNATQQELELADNYGQQITELNKQSNEETSIPQSQEVPAQEIVQETPEIAEQVAPIVESVEAIQETPEVEAAEIEQPPQKTAEELDVRRGEIESRLPQIEAELEALRSKPLLESTEEDADMEDFLLAEQADLQNEFEDIAETRKTVRTAKETEIEQEAQRVEALTQKTQRVADIEGEIAQIEEASKALPIRERLSAKANIEALNAEKEALSTEIEALQPKKETPTSAKNAQVETPIAETPIIAETPQLESKVEGNQVAFESAKQGDVVMFNGEEYEVISKKKSRGGNDVVEIKKTGKRTKEEIKKAAINTVRNRVRGQYKKAQTDAEIEKNHFGAVMKEVQDETATENANTSVITVDKGQWDDEVVSKKETAETPQLETPIVESKKKEPEPIQKEVAEKLPEVGGIEEGVVEKEQPKPQVGVKISKEKGETWIESYNTAWKEAKESGDGNKMESMYNAVKVALNGVAQSENTVKEFEALKAEIENHAKELKEAKKQEPEKSPEPEKKQPEKVAKTPVAPAAPKEQKPQPEKGTMKIFNPAKPKPQKPETQKEPTTIKPVQSGSELAEMLGNTEQAIETGKVWDRVAKMWAKKTGKAVEDWWNRIESIQVGGDKPQDVGTTLYQMNIGGETVTVRDLPNDLDIVNGFYSPIEKMLLETKRDTNSAAAWLSMLGKGDEMQYTGLKAFLESKKPNEQIKKSEIQQFLKDNRIEIVEVVKGRKDLSPDKFNIEFENNEFVVTRNGKKEKTFKNDSDANDYIAKEQINDGLGVTQFSQYQLEGEKDNYREVLITMPFVYEKEIAPLRKLYESGEITDIEFNDRAVAIKRRYGQQDVYRSSHFDEPNILAHLRMNTRVDADGNKVLFLEELQSDWGQEGKKKGFNNPRYRQLEKQESEANDKLVDYFKKNNPDKLSISALAEIDPKMKILWDNLKDIQRELDKETNGETPTAPFVTDTNAWVKLGLKVALQHAINEGVDKIAWTTGEQQNDRYDLSKVISSVTAKQDGTAASDNAPMYEIESKYKSGEETTGSYREDELEGVLGKDLAEKIINNKGGKYTGVDLQVGGKGMKGFYGSPTEGSIGIVGNVAKSLFKQVPKTTKIELPKKEFGGKEYPEELEEAIQDYHSENESHFDFSTLKINDNKLRQRQDELNKIAKKYGAVLTFEENGNLSNSTIPNTSTQHSIDITPQMRQQAQQGQSLFQAAKGSVTLENNKFKVFLASDRDVSTPVHELAHIFQTDLSESEKKSVVAWYNKGNKTNHKVTDWGFAENETSRNISEYFAEGFVEWLKEGGKTTDKAMQSVFDKFKGWLKDVVNTVFDAKVELNDDMRAIYEQIFTEKEKRQIKIDRRGAKKGAMIRVVPRDLIDKSATNPLQVVWNYFAEGGRINREDAIKRLKSRYKGKEIPSDIMIAIAPFIKKEGQKRGDIVHNLYEMVSQDNPLLGLTDQDFDSAMDEVLDSLGGNFRGDMIAALQGFKNKEEEYVPTEDEIMEMENREAIDAAMYDIFEDQDVEVINPIVYDLFEGIDRFEAEAISREIEQATDKDGNVDWGKIEALIDFLLANPESAKTAKFKSLIEKINESRQVQPSEVLSPISEKVAESAADKAYRAKREAEFAEKIGKLRQNLKTAKDEAAKKYATLTKNEIGFEKEGKNVQLELVSEAEKEMSDVERIMIPYKSAIADIEREIKRLQDAMDKVIDAEIKAKNEKGLFDSGELANLGEKEVVADSSKMYSASSRFKPHEVITFNEPIVGKNGNKLMSYTWAYEWTMLPNWEGEHVSKRVSDWTQAESSADTGKDIVHQYVIQKKDGTIVTVSSESVPILLGYTDRQQMKSLPSIVSSVKTLAKQRMQLAIMEAQEKEYNALKKKYEAAKKPEIVEADIADLPTVTRRMIEAGRLNPNEFTYFKMGGNIVKQEGGNHRKLSKETTEHLGSSWVESRIAEDGGKFPSGIRDLRNRIERQERRVEAATGTKISISEPISEKEEPNILYQTDPYHKSLEDWLVGEISAETLQSNPEELRAEAFDEIVGDVGETVANEIIDRAFERILTPKTESEILESELGAASKEKKATAEELIEMDDFRTKVLADLPPNATQEQFAEAKATIEAKLEKSNLSEAEKKFILSKIKERQFGAKFRETYSQEMSKELQERVLGKTYFYNALSNDAAKTQAEIRLKGYYDTAIEEVSQKWYESGKLTDENAKQVMTDPAFLQDVMQATVNDALRNLDNIANIENYWEKVAATNYAIKAAGELEKSLREIGKESAANSIVDLVEMAVEKLARTGTALGRAVNMFGLYANMGANIAKTILMKQINDFNANLSDKQKALKETIESTVNDINNIVQDMANGKDSELLTRIMDAVAKNPKVEELLNEIMNRWESLDNEGQYKTILSEAYWAQREIDALNKEIAKLKGQADIDAVTITTLENKVIEKQKKIANLNAQIRRLKDEKGITERAERQAKTEAEKAVIVKAAKVKATKTTTDAAFSRLRGYKNDNTNTLLQRRVSGMAGNYNAKTIKDVNRFIETLVDEYYEVNTQHTIDGNYVADFNSYALAELATKQANPNLAIDPTLYRDITTTITAGQFDQSVRDYTQDRIDKDYKDNMRKRVVGVMKDPAKALQPKTQKAEIRLALGELIMQAATARTTEKQNIQKLIEDTFGITGANVNALATEFDKQFNEQVLAKQMQIAGKRMLTAQEQSKKTDEEIGKEYVKQLEKKGEKPFLENLAKDLRLSQGIGWSQDILDRMSNKYQMNIHSQAQKNELDRLFDIAEKAPEGTPKQKAMHDVMLQVIRMSYYGNLRKWEMTKHAIRHSNKLSGLSTQLSNIIDSVYKLVDLYIFNAYKYAYKDTHKVRVAAVTKALKGAAWKSAWNKFNLQEARLQGDFENIAEFFATNFAELPLELRGIKHKESVGFLKFLNLIAEAVIQPLYTGKFKGDNSHSVATLIRGVMNFWDNVATESLKAGEQAVLLSQIGPTLNISNEMDIDMADTKQFNSGFTIGQIMADEMADSWYTAGSREAFERKQELLSQYLQEKYGTEEVADDYARAETYKKPPSGFIGIVFKKVNEVVRDANRANIERIQEYENKRRNKVNRGVNKDLAWYKFASMGTEMVNMFDYMRTQLNVLNMVMDRSIWLNVPRLLLNKSFGDTFSRANVDTYKKQFESIHDKEGKKLQTSSVEFVNIGSQIYEINKAETVVDDKIKAHQEDARLKKKKSADKATSEIAKVNNQKTLATVTKQRKIADINRIKAQEDTNTDKMLANAITPLNTQKQVMAIQRKALVAGYVQAQTRIKDRLFHSALVNMIGATIAFLIASGDDEDEETLFDLVGDTQLKDVGSVQAMKNVNEAKAVKRFIFRYGQLTGNVPNLGIKNTSQTSFAWGDTPYVFDFSIWASIADAIKRVKYGKEEAITPSNAIDVVSQATLATLWQMGGQVGTQNLAEAADPKANLAWWERFMKVLGSSITFQNPAILRHTISDVIYGGQGYARNKDASDMNYLVANYFRMHGLHPRFGANYMAELAGAEQPFIEQYSPVDGKPVLVWTNRDRLEVYRGIRGLYDMAKGNETKLRSINQSGYKTEDVQDYLVFMGWLAKTGAATKISISNPQNIMPEYKDDKLAYLRPIPEKDFQEKIVKIAGTDIGISMKAMYDRDRYLTKIPKVSEGSISNAIKEAISADEGISRQDLIEAVKSGEFDTKSEIYSYLAKSDEMAYKIGVQVIAKKVAKAERDKAIIEYLQERPDFAKQGESVKDTKERLEEK